MAHLISCVYLTNGEISNYTYDSRKRGYTESPNSSTCLEEGEMITKESTG